MVETPGAVCIQGRLRFQGLWDVDGTEEGCPQRMVLSQIEGCLLGKRDKRGKVGVGAGTGGRLRGEQRKDV